MSTLVPSLNDFRTLSSSYTYSGSSVCLIGSKIGFDFWLFVLFWLNFDRGYGSLRSNLVSARWILLVTLIFVINIVGRRGALCCFIFFNVFFYSFVAFWHYLCLTDILCLYFRDYSPPSFYYINILY